MSLTAPDAQFAQSSAVLIVQIQSNLRRVRHGIGLAILGSDQWVWTDVPADGSATVQIAFKPERRGRHRVPTLTAETRFPMGTFRVWTVWRPTTEILVYPLPEPLPPPLPPGAPRAGAVANKPVQASGDYDGVRSYRRGDPMKGIVWKKVAKSDELVSRDAQQAQRLELWLDQRQTGIADLEAQLSRLCAWLLQAEKLELDYGLRLAGLEIDPGRGDVHKKRCLEALARH